MEAFLISTGVVALAEIGDKTQLLSLVLAARFRKPIPIVFGILIATLFNHAFAGAIGSWLTTLVGPATLRWVLGISFLLMAGWTLIPDKVGDTPEDKGRFGVFTTTLVAFFLAEMGDKTQIATIALAAKYASLIAVVAGTTLGMMLANVPVVILGDKAAKILPLKLIRSIAAAIFAVLGLLALFNAGPGLG
ncbi:MAG: hypothetical protein JWO30_158 [Fibrobacteres bacterium]|nr:hypothetical protein [Fibrobacterota bacterium]